MYRLRGVRGAAGVRVWQSAPLQRRVAMERGCAIRKVAAAARKGSSVPLVPALVALQSSTLTRQPPEQFEGASRALYRC